VVAVVDGNIDSKFALIPIKKSDTYEWHILYDLCECDTSQC
jgi:hypothetical protein